MKSKRCWLFAACLLGIAPTVQAAPWQNLFLPKRYRVEADPNKPYTLREEHGPWLIMATSFRGEDAAERAHKLVIELRKRYKLEAFAHHRKFDYSGPVVGRGVNRYGDPKQMRYINEGRVQEVAVLAGQFDNVDDPLAQKTLAQLKEFRPECLETEEKEPEVVEDDGDVSLAGFRAMIRRSVTRELTDGLKYINRKKNKGRLANAFLVPNPLLPRDEVHRKALDPLVYEMNKNAQYSLLDAPKQYTVVVATFKGYSSVDQKKIQDVATGHFDESLPSRLDEAAQQANRLAHALRVKMNYEAYEFHDRHASMVCVGSFEWVGRRRPDGTIEMNPRVQRVLDEFRAERQFVLGQPNPKYGTPKTLDGIPFDPDPTPVEVPRPSVGSQYARRSIFSRR